MFGFNCFYFEYLLSANYFIRKFSRPHRLSSAKVAIIFCFATATKWQAKASTGRLNERKHYVNRFFHYTWRMLKRMVIFATKTKIDIRVEKEIKFYSKSAKILTMHPSGSYTLQRNAQKQYVLRITNPQIFWSTSKYLVVVVK